MEGLGRHRPVPLGHKDLRGQPLLALQAPQRAYLLALHRVDTRRAVLRPANVEPTGGQLRHSARRLQQPPVAALPTAKITSGARATVSATYLRTRSGSLAPQRMSMRTLRPSVHPDCASVCANARTRLCCAGSSDARLISTPMRR